MRIWSFDICQFAQYQIINIIIIIIIIIIIVIIMTQLGAAP